MSNTFTAEEISQIKTKMDKGLFSLARIYGPFLMALVLAYFYARPKATKADVKASDYDYVYIIVFGFFLMVFSIFAIREYKKKVAPFKKELATGSKTITPFTARKYFDPIYKNHLLYHPFQEKKYLLLTEQDFNSMNDGDRVELYTGSVTGLVLAIKINGKLVTSVEDFGF